MAIREDTEIGDAFALFADLCVQKREVACKMP
jgi:hypothetical protein